ncbi:hypothetical protein Aph02nite_68810 [Actinoplanes philippinensis]|nr:hypothetical protein Aph02nite_68810 [Actinoplanes philippinensis]
MERVDYNPERVTIVRARYGGLYEPGTWVAFACWPEDLSPDWNADDATCAGFFAERADETGGGDSPQEAYADLLQRLAARRKRLR